LLTVSFYIKMHLQTHELLGSASEGQVARVQQLLDSGVPLDAASKGGFTAIHAACMTRQHGVLELLLQHYGEQQGGSSSASLEPHLPRCIAAAASMGHASIIQSLTAAVGNMQQIDLQRWGPLHAAAAAGHAEAVQLLLQQCGMAVDQPLSGRTPLHHAASKGAVQVVTLLLQAGADIDVKSASDGKRPLHLAAQAGHAHVVQLLLQAGADMDATTDSSSHIALHLAARSGHAHVLQQLLQAGVDVDARTADRWTPLHLAADIAVSK
jgi:ankyrin repeat protein